MAVPHPHPEQPNLSPAEPAPKAGLSDLFAAVASGSLDALRAEQAKGTPLDAADEGGRTALMVAAEAGHVALMEALLAEGCALHAATSLGWTALAYAAFAGRVDAIRFLVSRGLVVDEPDVSRAAPLSWAAAKGHAAAVRALLELGADAGACDVHGRTALAHAAGGTDDAPTIEALAADEACAVDAADVFGRTPLIAAVLANRPRAVDALLRAGADARVADAHVPGVVGPPTGPSAASASAAESERGDAAAEAEAEARPPVGKTALDHARERKFKHIERCAPAGAAIARTPPPPSPPCPALTSAPLSACRPRTTAGRYLLAVEEAAASGAPVAQFPPAADQVLVRERMRTKLAAEAGAGAAAEGGAVLAAGAGGGRAGGGEDIFEEVDEADEAGGAVGALHIGAGDEPARDVDAIEGSLEDLD